MRTVCLVVLCTSVLVGCNSASPTSPTPPGPPVVSPPLPPANTVLGISLLGVFNWSSTTNAGVTTMSGAFTKIEPYRTGFGEPYTIRTEHEFTGLPHTQ